jgi:hypothetical protein
MGEIRWEEFEDVLAYGGTLRFAGSAREISEQFLLAAACLRDRVYSGGIVGLDYEVIMDRVQSSPTDGFGGWLQDSLPTLIEIRAVAHEALDDAEEWKARAWLAVRQPLPEKSTERGFSEATHIPKTNVHRALAEIDERIVAALRGRGYVVRGAWTTTKAPVAEDGGARDSPATRKT